jgi:pimeloyl-ACP methyl ester carboxylesterase
MLFHNWYFIILDHVSTILEIFRENFYYWVLLVSALTWLGIPYNQLLLVLLPERETRKEYLSKQIESMQASEASLMEYALRFANTAKNCSFDGGINTTGYDCQIYDTKIEKSCIVTSLGKSSSSLQCQLVPPPHATTTHQREHDDPFFIIHGVKVQRIRTTKYNNSSALSTSTSLPPLVFLHGYAGGAFYFYRNLVGLASHFSAIYSIDLLGWGLSSRPSVWSHDNLQSVDSVESFFVESLERWRQKNFTADDEHKQPKIIIAAHSIGAYLSVAYCEKYSQFVQHLLLLSPVGVLPTPIQPSTTTTTVQQKTNTCTTTAATTSTPTTKKQHTPLFLTSSFRTQMVKLLWKWGVTPGMILRYVVPERQGRKLVSNYVQRRFFAIQCDQEKASLCNYLVRT